MVRHLLLVVVHLLMLEPGPLRPVLPVGIDQLRVQHHDQVSENFPFDLIISLH